MAVNEPKRDQVSHAPEYHRILFSKKDFPKKTHTIIDALEGVKSLDGGSYTGGRRISVKTDVAILLVGLALARRPKFIFEMGTAHGFSALCFALANTDTSIVSVEMDPAAAELARQTFNNVGLADRCTVVTGLAHEVAAGLSTGIDMVFIDHHPDRYLVDFKSVEPHLTSGAIVLADNATDHRDRTGVNDFVKYMFDKYENTVVLPTRSGLLCSRLP